MAKSKFRIIDDLREKYGSRYLLVLLASKVAKIIAEKKQEQDIAARLGIPDEDAKPTILALHKLLREGVKYSLEEDRKPEEQER
jgi:DNA-directed RNA polymerase omega subunit